MVCFGTILRFIISKEIKTPSPKKNKGFSQNACMYPKHFKRFKSSMEWHKSIDASS
jgi:hypothetical protein